MSVNISDVLKIVSSQNQWRGKEAINLIASENVQSNAVKQVEVNDFMGRYAEGHPNTSQETYTALNFKTTSTIYQSRNPSLPVISHDNISVRFLRASHHLKYQGCSRIQIQRKKVKDAIDRIRIKDDAHTL